MTWTFSKQHRQCREDGTKQAMTNDKFEQLPGEAKQDAEMHRKFWQASDHSGLGFCGKQPGICGLKHCRKIGMVKV